MPSAWRTVTVHRSFSLTVSNSSRLALTQLIASMAVDELLAGCPAGVPLMLALPCGLIASIAIAIVNALARLIVIAASTSGVDGSVVPLINACKRSSKELTVSLA